MKLKTREQRINNIRKLYNKFSFVNNIYIFGFGAVGRPLLWMLLKIIKINKSNITVFDKFDIILNDYEKEIYDSIKFVKIQITKDNYKKLLKDLNNKDLIIDCAYGISTIDIIDICSSVGAYYINSCVESWYSKAVENPIKNSLSYRLKEVINKNNKNFTGLIGLGANPGLVSLFMKIAIDNLYKQDNKLNYAEKAQNIGIEVIHISERDSQKSKIPKNDHEYCNTWSTDGESYFEEILACSEGTWGTHENNILQDMTYLDGSFIWNKMGMYCYAQSYVPINGRFIGNIVTHEESYTMGKYLSIRDKDKIIYQPSVYFVYHSCNEAMMSVSELKDRNLRLQPTYRLLTDEIIDGRDELGLTIFLKNKNIYWIGSLLSVLEAREIYENKYDEYINATIVQVVSGYLSGVIFIIGLIRENKHMGIIFPEDLPHQNLLSIFLPFLGDFVFEKITDKFKLINIDTSCVNNDKETNEWQFKNFLIFK